MNKLPTGVTPPPARWCERLSQYYEQKAESHNRKSQRAVCQMVRDMGDIGFIIDTLESDKIRTLYERRWFPESLYLLARWII
ncbi:MAG: hypothetical protein LBU32_08500 [Clostridiales bacterium]|nr:hypothetical protein [Clostridiales bacterium]